MGAKVLPVDRWAANADHGVLMRELVGTGDREHSAASGNARVISL